MIPWRTGKSHSRIALPAIHGTEASWWAIVHRVEESDTAEVTWNTQNPSLFPKGHLLKSHQTSHSLFNHIHVAWCLYSSIMVWNSLPCSTASQNSTFFPFSCHLCAFPWYFVPYLLLFFIFSKVFTSHSLPNLIDYLSTFFSSSWNLTDKASIWFWLEKHILQRANTQLMLMNSYPMNEWMKLPWWINNCWLLYYLQVVLCGS